MATQTGSIDLKAAKGARDEAAKVADNYLATDNTGIMVFDGSGGARYSPSNAPTGVKNVVIDSDSMDVRDGQTVLATFGSTSRIGQETSKNLQLANDVLSFRTGTTKLLQIAARAEGNYTSGSLDFLRNGTVVGSISVDTANTNELTIASTGNIYLDGNHVYLDNGGGLSYIRSTNGNDTYISGEHVSVSADYLDIMGALTISGMGGSIFTTDLGVSGELTVEDHSSPIGTVFDGTVRDSLSLTSGTAKYLARLPSLPHGTWIATGFVQFPGNSTGLRRVNISTTQDSTAINVQVNGTANAIQLEVVQILQPSSSGTTYYLNAFQNSGSSLTAANVSFRAVRIA